MNVYRMNDYDFVAAASLDEARTHLIESTGMPADEILEDEYELSFSQMAGYVIFDEETNQSETFMSHLLGLIGEGQSFPCYFAAAE